MGVLVSPLAAPGDVCSACLQPTAGHTVKGRWIGCQTDIVVGRDQETFARRLRLARLQSRVSRVRPFGVDVEGMQAR